MNKLIISAMIVFMANISKAAVGVYEYPITGYTLPYAVALTTYSYTNVTTSDIRALRGLNAVIIDNPSTNTASVHGHIGNCSSTSVSTTTVKGPIEIAPSSNGGSIAIEDGQCIWLISRHTSSESITIQGITQR